MLIESILNTEWLGQLWVDLQLMSGIEVSAVLTGVAYVVLATRQHIACWFFGIVSSLLSIYLFATGKLYAESLLYSYYVIAGIYGWYNWQRGHGGKGLPVIRWPWQKHLRWGIIGVCLAIALGKILSSYTDAAQPFVDAHTTIFSFIATYLTTKKVLENWQYWIIIDMVSIWLYADRGFALYALLMLVYTVIAVFGYWRWREQMQFQERSV